jgi:hypothetical protein
VVQLSWVHLLAHFPGPGNASGDACRDPVIQLYSLVLYLYELLREAVCKLWMTLQSSLKLREIVRLALE